MYPWTLLLVLDPGFWIIPQGFCLPAHWLFSWISTSVCTWFSSVICRAGWLDSLFIHIVPSICYLNCVPGVLACPRCHQVRGGLHPGQVASLSRGWHVETNNSHSHSHLRTILSLQSTTHVCFWKVEGSWSTWRICCEATNHSTTVIHRKKEDTMLSSVEPLWPGHILTWLLEAAW